MARRSLIAGAAFVALVAVLQPSGDAIGAAKNKAGVVVRGEDGTTDEMCVFFDEPSVSGLDLLNRSGASVVVEESAVGTAICKIGEGGCESPSEECFCDYPRFWGYWTRDPGDRKFAFASVGAADREVVDGSVDGWSWGKDGKPAPPNVPFEDVCAAKNVVSASAAASPTARAASPVASTRPNYGAFAGFAALFALLAGGAVLFRRRRTG